MPRCLWAMSAMSPASWKPRDYDNPRIICGRPEKHGHEKRSGETHSRYSLHEKRYNDAAAKSGQASGTGRPIEAGSRATPRVKVRWAPRLLAPDASRS